MKKVGLVFPKNKMDKPVISDLVRIYDIEFNILQSSIKSGEAGRMILGLTGEVQAIDAGLKFLTEQGVKVIEFTESVVRIKEKCVDCGACTGVCPSGALSLDENYKLNLDNDLCLMCDACVTACPMRALKSREDLLNIYVS